ncbi:hypothetical protein [Nevskia soli]|uniref:hypothetical protein n=1 Tax=Nevskia soli TaxID=418856 RepID=UPI0012F735AC|nr:hypothetical protein [Nevskia soli]
MNIPIGTILRASNVASNRWFRSKKWADLAEKLVGAGRKSDKLSELHLAAILSDFLDIEVSISESRFLTSRDDVFLYLYRRKIAGDALVFDPEINSYKRFVAKGQNWAHKILRTIDSFQESRTGQSLVATFAFAFFCFALVGAFIFVSASLLFIVNYWLHGKPSPEDQVRFTSIAIISGSALIGFWFSSRGFNFLLKELFAKRLIESALASKPPSLQPTRASRPRRKTPKPSSEQLIG